jgi:hypothetical protein
VKTKKEDDSSHSAGQDDSLRKINARCARKVAF